MTAINRTFVAAIQTHEKFSSPNFKGREDVTFCSACKQHAPVYVVYSYETAIYQRCNHCSTQWLNTTKYGTSTSHHQRTATCALNWDTSQCIKVSPRYRGDTFLDWMNPVISA